MASNVAHKETQAPMTADAYLSTSYRPDCEYIDGLINERNLGEFDHAELQGETLTWLRSRAQEWNIRALPEQRVQVSPTRFRVPDICVLRRDRPIEQIVRDQPLICIEILSPDDSLHDMRERVDDYLAMGVEHVWILDPSSRKGYVCTATGINEPDDGELFVPGTPIRLSLAELFSRVDRA